MKPSRTLPHLGVLLLLVTLAQSPVSLWASEPPAAPIVNQYQLLVNPGMEVYDPPYTQYRGADCQVASGWEPFWYGGPEPYWMDTRVFASNLGTGWVERIEGATSQMILATEPYTAGLQQQVTGLMPGVGYGFHAAMLTIFETSAPPAVDGTMVKEVGMDPTGGTDPQASTVIWSEVDDHDEGPWSIDLRTAVYAEAPTMTVFIRVTSLYESGGWPLVNLSFLDSAILAETPQVTATSPVVAEEPAFIVNWDNAVAAPGGYVRWYDVQWLDEVGGVWHDWFVRTSEVEAPFVGELGHTYRFRARAWQRYDNNAHLYGPYRPDGDTVTWVGGPLLTGYVWNNEGLPVAGATVAISGTGYAATSDHAGRYEIRPLPSTEPQTVSVSHPVLLSPAPVQGVTFGLTETVSLTWTLRPADDKTVNGGFEEGLAGWSLLADQDIVPTVVSDPVHTGQGALALGGTAPFSYTVGVTQSTILTDTWQPALSFWYRPVPAGTDGPFNVILTIVTRTISTTLPVTPSVLSSAMLSEPITTTLSVTTTHIFTPALDVEGWQHQWYYLGPLDVAMTGTATIFFRVSYDPATDGAATTVYLDEVSLGASSGGPYQIYLPLIQKP